MMLDIINLENTNTHFQESVKELERITHKAQLIRKIEVRSQESETASPEELIEILTDLKSYRDQIRLLD